MFGPVVRTARQYLSQPSGRRRVFIVLASIFIAGYCLAIFSFVLSIPDIGLRCAFKPIVNRVFPEYVFDTEGQDARELVGATITKIGSDRVENWPQVLRVLNQLRRDNSEPIDDASQMSAGEFVHVRLDGTEWVRVELEKPGEKREIWCRVGRVPFATLLPSILWFFLKGGLFVVAAMVFWKRPLDRSGSMFFWLSLCTVCAYMGGFHWWRIVTEPALLVVFVVSAVLVPAVGLHFYLVFPRPKEFLDRHPVATLGSLYALPGCFLILLLSSYWRTRWLFPEGSTRLEVENALGSICDTIYHLFGATSELDSALELLKTIILVYLAVATLLYLASVLCLGHSFRTSANITERNQVKWILTGVLMSVAPIVYSLYLAFVQPSEFGGGAATWPMFLASVIVTASYTVAITRYRLMQLDQLVSWSMAYFLVSFLAGLIYYGVVFLGTLLFSQWIARPTLPQALTVSSTVLVFMLALDWLRGRVKRALDRRFHREKYQLERTLRRMSQAIDQLVDPPTLARRLLQAVAELLNVTRGAVYLREGAEPLFRLVDSVGEPPPLSELSSGFPLVEQLESRGTVVLRPRQRDHDPAQRQLAFIGGETARALSHEGKMLAILVLGQREMGSYGAEDLNLLSAFAQITALGLLSTQGHRKIEGLNRDLQEKVAKIAEQQRSILALQSKLSKGDERVVEKADESRGVVQAAPAAAPRDGDIVGTSPAIRLMLGLVHKVAASQSAVLIRGESGTGKELLARALHQHGPRASRPFVTVHCAALSPMLLESELFGHVKGAFTGAHRDKVGRFELANGGTLFLDEIGDISLDVQTKLLRVLQEMTFERVGSSAPVQVDVRIIAATHRNLEQLIREDRFREDLYYRLNVISIPVPSLRQRREDIPELALHFLRVHAQKAGRAVEQIDDDAMSMLKGCHWPGNIRQLENVLQRAVVMAEGTVITPRDLPPELLEEAEQQASDSAVFEPRPAELSLVPSGLRSYLSDRDRLERERLVRALATANGNKAEAARALGLARSTFHSRLKKFRLS
jgi:transcriptional regulator with GAF, ATPase, and Fis domain